MDVWRGGSFRVAQAASNTAAAKAVTIRVMRQDIGRTARIVQERFATSARGVNAGKVRRLSVADVVQ
jgi:hypothetical protein